MRFVRALFLLQTLGAALIRSPGAPVVRSIVHHPQLDSPLLMLGGSYGSPSPPRSAYAAFGGALRPLRQVHLAHGALLPRLTRQLISHRDRLILAFVLEYLVESGLDDVAVHISGGYVRDLLLGRESDDLDLSLCLRSCAPHVTVDTVVDGMPAFSHRRPELGIDAVDVVTALSDASKGKNVDAAQLRFTIRSVPSLVDLMPTIRSEMYDTADRIPRRDGRGTPEQDTLRRDLTIGSMLLHVSRPGRQRDISSVEELMGKLSVRLNDEWASSSADDIGKCVLAAEAAATLEFRLLDYHGGVDDLQARVLRPPHPRNRTLSDVWREVFVSQEEEELASQLGLHRNTAEDDEEMLQAVWWVKVLRDDPLRLVRALRFSASLGFRVDPSFWTAVPFAVEALRTKVSGPRKVTELLKIAKMGRAKLLDFFELAFEPLVAFGDEVAFGDALFGGPSSDTRRLSVTMGFDAMRMHAAAAALPPDDELCADGVVGGVLAAALISCDLRRCEPELMALESTVDAHAQRAGAMREGSRVDVFGACGLSLMLQPDYELTDAEAADVALISLREARRACDGLCASSAMRQAVVEPLSIIVRMLQPPTPLGHHYLFADAANDPRLATVLSPQPMGGLDDDPVSQENAESSSNAKTTQQQSSGSCARSWAQAGAEGFASMVRLWDVLKLDPTLSQRQLQVGADFVLALVQTRCTQRTADRLRAKLHVLRSPGPTVRGAAVAGVPGVPPHLRGLLIAQLHVLCRLRGETLDFETPEALITYLSDDCDGLLGRLQDEWWESGWTEDPKPVLRDVYSKGMQNAWARAGVVD